jgi:hypothetical protein
MMVEGPRERFFLPGDPGVIRAAPDMPSPSSDGHRLTLGADPTSAPETGRREWGGGRPGWNGRPRTDSSQHG